MKQILLFVNGISAPPMNTNGGATPMQLGCMAQPEAESPPQGPEQPAEDPSWQNWYWGNEEDQWNGEDQHLNAMKGKGGKGGKGGEGKSREVCHGCGSPDHFIAECPSNPNRGKSTWKGAAKAAWKGSWGKKPWRRSERRKVGRQRKRYRQVGRRLLPQARRRTPRRVQNPEQSS